MSASQKSAAAPSIAGLTLEASYDDGAHWAPATVRRVSDGRYQVTLKHPNSTGAVSLRTVAWDTAGNRVVQRMNNAYLLSR